MLKVLVTGCGGGVGQGIIKSLKMIYDLDIFIIAADMSPLAAGLYGGDKSVLIPSASDQNYFCFISDFCKKEKINYYFPGTDVELKKASMISHSLFEQTGTVTPVCHTRVIEIADDKLKTYQFLKDNNFYCPETFTPDGANLESIKYPVIVKPRVGCRSIGVYKVNNLEEASSAIAKTENPIIQEFIDGDEYTCTVVRVDNKISDVLCLKRDLRAGDTYRAYPEKNEIIENYVRNIALKLDIYGSCNFQLRVFEGQPKLFEINSRFSGTTPFCAQLGFNPVEFYIRSHLGLAYKSNINYDAIVLRHWCEIVISKTSIAENSIGKLYEVGYLSASRLK